MKPSLFAYVSTFSAILPLAAGIIFWKALSTYLRLIIWLSLVSLLADGCSLLFVKLAINSWPVINLFLIIQFVLLFIALRNQRPAFLMAFYTCIAFSAADYFFIEGPKHFNSYTSYASGILMILSAIAFLYKLMVDMPVERVQTLPLFWLSFAILIYYGGTLFLFLFNNLILAHLPNNSHQTIWILHNVLNLGKNVFLFLTLWMSYKHMTSLP